MNEEVPDWMIDESNKIPADNARLQNVVDELSQLMQRLVQSLRKASPDSALPAKALDYLKRNELLGSPLREVYIGMTRVEMICDSYESGYGHGLKNDGLNLSKTPHSDLELGEAYQVGYQEGLECYEKVLDPGLYKHRNGTL